MARLTQVISGGQTGVDQASLLAAKDSGLTIGGWCPPNRACEIGEIPAGFPLRPTPQDRSPLALEVPHSQRTEWNVRDSDATLILRPATYCMRDLGSEYTAACAARLGRPTLICDPSDAKAAQCISHFIESLQIETLNIAGPRESQAAGIGEKVYVQLTRVFAAKAAR